MGEQGIPHLTAEAPSSITRIHELQIASVPTYWLLLHFC